LRLVLRRRNLPEPLVLKRFAAALRVFSLGMGLLSENNSKKINTVYYPTSHLEKTTSPELPSF
jgi:hypothetical protein